MSAGVGLPLGDLYRLDAACRPIRQAFGSPPYLVGTAGDSTSWRDVDVRLILADEEFDALFAIFGQPFHALLSVTISAYLKAATGLPVDFQIQRRTEANKKHGGKVYHDHAEPIVGCRCEEKYGRRSGRNALGTRDLTDFQGDATWFPAKEVAP